jgi:hypothetical protein
MLESLAALRAGLIDALGITLDEETPPTKDDTLAGGRIQLAPPCRFCHFSFLCGLAWEKDQ